MNDPRSHSGSTSSITGCHSELAGGVGRVVATGIRAEESSRRRSRGIVNVCRKSGNEKALINPIIHWTHDDVWEYIRRRELPYCSLYDEGWKRLGCVFCTYESRRAETKARWPKMFAALMHNVRKAWPTWQQRLSWQGKTEEFMQSPEKFLEWWWDMPHGYERDGDEQCALCSTSLRRTTMKWNLAQIFGRK